MLIISVKPSCSIETMKISSLPHGKTRKDAEERRRIVENAAGFTPEHLYRHSFEPEIASHNIENFIGVTQIPLGIAGPLKVRGKKARGSFFVPLATTEGALVATINRGCSVITEAGGAYARVMKDEMTRAPVFRTEGLEHGLRISRWINDNFHLLAKETGKVTRHGKIISAVPYICGRTMFIRLSFETGDAMGMNIATFASQKICELIERETGAVTISVSGNMCTDKKPSAINYILGRGKTVIAEATIPEVLVKQRLHSSPAEIAETALRKNLIGSAMALSMGYNSHFANMAAALFIATGQDAAQVVEASMGISTAETTDRGLYVSVRIPALELGTVGGGTALPSQSEALKLMGCSGTGKSVKFAEIAASTILAGELSTMAAQVKGELALAHMKLAR
ncbi:MAG: hydroxymethylglutaryl-CoA reductase [Candidatus Thermoplasmatota archaeon]|nr:hydroxymethylglutaryl-CoA reductase [Candidatus Thermoplasmatota archaeon]